MRHTNSGRTTAIELLLWRPTGATRESTGAAKMRIYRPAASRDKQHKRGYGRRRHKHGEGRHGGAPRTSFITKWKSFTDGGQFLFKMWFSP
eukprot:1683266-Pyramimonas_sp.AAC.1